MEVAVFAVVPQDLLHAVSLLQLDLAVSGGREERKRGMVRRGGSSGEGGDGDAF